MRKNKKKNSIILLVLLLLGITLGYSLLSSNLNISSTTGLSNNTWNIHWSNLAVTNGSVTGTQVTTPAAIKTGDTEVEYSITLSTPGDYYEFTVDAVNEGSIDAMIESFSNKTYESNGTTEKTLPTYLNYSVTYSDGIALAPKQKLAANTTEKIKVRVEFKKDIEANQLPTTADTIVFKFNVTYAQADNTAEAVNHSRIVYTVNKYDYNVTTTPKYNAVWLNQAFPTSITKYNTPSEALTAIATASNKNIPFYLKQKLENDVVTESYVEFVVTPEMAEANTGMIAGTYTLRGEKTYDRDTDTLLVGTDYISPYYEANKEAIKTAFGYSTNPSRCREYGTGRSSDFSCGVSGLYADAYARGIVDAGDDDSSFCTVYDDGYSSCYWK